MPCVGQEVSEECPSTSTADADRSVATGDLQVAEDAERERAHGGRCLLIRPVAQSVRPDDRCQEEFGGRAPPGADLPPSSRPCWTFGARTAVARPAVRSAARQETGSGLEAQLGETGLGATTAAGRPTESEEGIEVLRAHEFIRRQ